MHNITEEREVQIKTIMLTIFHLKDEKFKRQIAQHINDYEEKALLFHYVWKTFWEFQSIKTYIAFNTEQDFWCLFYSYTNTCVKLYMHKNIFVTLLKQQKIKSKYPNFWD